MIRLVTSLWFALFLLTIPNLLMAQQDRQAALDSLPTSVRETLQRVETLVEQDSLIAAHGQLLILSYMNALTQMWQHYVLGLVEFKAEEYAQGLTEFQTVVDYARTRNAASDSSIYFRLSAKSLKKIGWYQRKQKEYEKAYGSHAQAFLLYERFGSAEEIHDALISLDVDADLMGDPVLSETALNLSVSAARKITDDKKRFKALGMTHNNLTFALQKQGRYLEAEDAILKSVDYWKQFETLAGTAEHRVMWAWFGVGDMYETWAKALGAGDPDYANKINNGKSAFEKSLGLAREQRASAEDVKEIEHRLNKTLNDER